MTTTALHIAARGGSNLDVRKFFSLSDLRTRDEEGQTPLHLAAQHDQVDLIKLFLRKDPKLVNAQDNSGWTPLHMATNEMALKACEVLLNARELQVNLCNQDGAPPFLFLLKAAPKDQERLALYPHVLSLFLAKGASVDSRNRSGETAIHYAILKGNIAGLRFLIEHGADVNAINKLGETSLHYAVRQKQKEAVLALLDANADRSLASAEHCLPIDIASQTGFEEVREILLEHRSNKQPIERTWSSSSGSLAQEGYLWLLSGRRGKWKRYYFLSSGYTLSYSRNMIMESSSKTTVDLVGCVLKPQPTVKGDKEFSWEVILKDGKSLLLSAKNATTRATWLAFFRSMQTPRFDRRDSKTDANSSDNQQRDLSKQLPAAENSVCSDCLSRHPEWLSLKYGAVICGICAPYHQSLGSPIVSIYFSALPETSAPLGNLAVSTVFEADTNIVLSRPSSFDALVRHTFITDKYQLRKWGMDVANPKGIHRRETSVIPNLQIMIDFERYYLELRNAILTKFFFLSSRQIHLFLASPSYRQMEEDILPVLNNSAVEVSVQSLGLSIAHDHSGLLTTLADQVLIMTLWIKVLTQHPPKERTTPFDMSPLMRLVQAYEAVFAVCYDPFIIAAFQWWIPQILEYLALIEGDFRSKLFALLKLNASHIIKNSIFFLYTIVAPFLTTLPIQPAEPAFVSEISSRGNALYQKIELIVEKFRSSPDSEPLPFSGSASTFELPPKAHYRLSAIVFAFPDSMQALNSLCRCFPPGLRCQIFGSTSQTLFSPSVFPSDNLLFSDLRDSLSPQDLHLTDGIDRLTTAAGRQLIVPYFTPLLLSAILSLHFADHFSNRAASTLLSREVFNLQYFYRSALHVADLFFTDPSLFTVWTELKNLIFSTLQAFPSSSSEEFNSLLLSILHQIKWILGRLISLEWSRFH